MGFWSPQSLVADGRRHGIVVHRPHVDRSDAEAALDWGAAGPAGGPVGSPARQPDVRLGIATVRTVGPEMAARIAAGRPYASMEDLVRRGGVGRSQLEALATAGALEGLAPRDGGAEAPTTRPQETRRRALWAAGVVAQATPDRLPGLVTGEDAPVLPELAPLEEVAADMWATGLTVGAGAVELARPRLDALGVIPAGRLLGAETDGRVLVGGVVTHRQHPESAKGTVFLNLEDETGMVNVICSPGAWARWRHHARRAPALLVRGRLERVDGVVSVVAEKISRLDLGSAPLPPSRDFH
jgi:error-prone DNA polymerase